MTDTYVNPIAGESLLVKVSFDNGSTYAHPCLINTTRGFSRKQNTTTAELANCTNPSSPAQISRAITSIDTTISGEGILDSNTLVAYDQWSSSGNVNPVKFTVNLTGATSNTVTFTGNYLLTSFDVTGKRGDKTTVSLTMDQASGLVTTTVA